MKRTSIEIKARKFTGKSYITLPDTSAAIQTSSKLLNSLPSLPSFPSLPALFALCLIIISAFPLSLQGAEKTDSAEILVTFLPLGTGSASGTYYPLGKAIGDLITTRNEDLNVMAFSTRGSNENLQLLEDGEINMAIVQSDAFYFAVKGLKNYTGRKAPPVKAILSLYPEVVHLVVPGDSKVGGFADLRGKRVIVGAEGSGNLVTSLVLLSVFGIDENMITPGYLNYDEAIQAMSRGDYDAFILVAGLPTAALTELKARSSVKIVSLTEKDRAIICNNLTYMSNASIPAGTYAEQNSQIPTVALKALLVCGDQMSSSHVRTILSTIFDNLDFLAGKHPRAADISRETALQAIPDGFTHDAAAAFFQGSKTDTGIDTSDPKIDLKTAAKTEPPSGEAK
ncbi:MAG: hypothetical protein CVV64_14535 [Candidatus Wallbacteria bacterium HGW-Wallbacteria-1]|jgi:hypothetical protein|uniref:C4-dicarboxylate ABC transporter substrate-binding protein n=1 Tax=Candidatus Wallbacteria bacterium HGW-Wallbacteria-1 TaxID=2013854 RepID=A0A2N1PM59_9BACT|nr:MAG: hypothetical protein CVV64_14535 [Candidatus Wallbacteria bacterium HGW-Wallbacteria-1]